MDKDNLKFQSWSDYWTSFGNLCLKFQNSDRGLISNELKDAQLHVTGMTDGWFEFLKIFEKPIYDNRASLTEVEVILANDLIDYIKTPLTKRKKQQPTRGLAIWRLNEYVLVDISLLGDISSLRIKPSYRIYFHLHIFDQHQSGLT